MQATQITNELLERSVLDDPRVEEIWSAAVLRLGFRVERTGDAYASTDGRGTIFVGARETLDHDDSLAQLLFHELCHALVQGEENLKEVDWGLDNFGDRDVVREHGCLLLQAHLADAFALRAAMAPTTIYRAYYNEIPSIPLATRGEATAMAQGGLRFAEAAGWRPHLDRALAETAAILRAEGRWAPPGRHPLGGPVGRAPATCAACAWRYDGAGGDRCRAGDQTGPRVDPGYPACARWEPALDCRACGACCRAGFEVVTVAERDPVVWRRPEWVERRGPRFRLRRADDRCAALSHADGRWSCAIYDDRPQACHDVTAGGARCLAARRRMGLSA